MNLFELTTMTDISMDLLPNLVIAGAPKCGTSSIHSWLAAHPDVLGSVPKETYYFVDRGTHMYKSGKHIDTGLDGYGSFFHAQSGFRPSVVFESTPSYLYSATALRYLPDLRSCPRFIFVLREPSSQIYSMFQYFRNNWDWIPRSMSFSDYLVCARTGSHSFKGNELARDALRNAAYVDFLLRWRDRVGPDRMHVVLFDDLLLDQRAFMQALAGYLGLDASWYDDYPFSKDNETYQPRSGLLQRLNVAVRGALPSGPTYRALRRLYRRLNTRRPPPPTDADLDVLLELRDEYTEANARLAVAFHLDISSWAN